MAYDYCEHGHGWHDECSECGRYDDGSTEQARAQAIAQAATIEQLTILMRALGPGPGEATHQLADLILRRAIQLLAPAHPDHEDVTELLRAWEVMHKWFA